MAHPMMENAKVYVEGLDHAECIAIHPDGSVWAGGEAGQIYRIDPATLLIEEIANTGGFILGIAFSPGGDWLAICDLGKKCIWNYNLHAKLLSLLAEGVSGHQLNIPNYAVFDTEGNLYISESGDFRQVNGMILKLHQNGKKEIWHAGPFNFANGMALSPDGKYLYVVSSFLPGVERIEIKEDGSAGKRELYCTMPETIPDGIAFAANGDLFVSCYTPNTIFKITPDRTSTVFIHDWEAHTLSNPTNIAFGGDERTTLYTANLGRWHITAIETDIEGLALASHIQT
jgi:sugar lactone lactonase YvrE